MPTDIALDHEGHECIALAASEIRTSASDVIIDCPARHKGKPGPRRALVHDQNDGLTINYNGDYSGGITLNDAQVRLKVHTHVGWKPILPRRGVVGELYAVSLISMEAELRDTALMQIDDVLDHTEREKAPLNIALAMLRDEIARPQAEISLWMCVGITSFGHARWQRIALADTVDGTL